MQELGTTTSSVSTANPSHVTPYQPEYGVASQSSVHLYLTFAAYMNTLFPNAKRVKVKKVKTPAPPAPIPGEFSCNFEQGWCPGWNQSNSDALDWTIGQGPTKTSRTGPGVDHTLGTKDGRYAYVEATGARFGRKAIFRTPFVDMNKHDKYCFRYWYHMYGSGMGNLKVIWSPPKQFGNNRKSLFLISTNSGSQSKNETDWLLEEVNVISPKTFKYTKPVYFEFQATRGATSRSDVAIDDVSLVPGSCQKSKTQASTTVSVTSTSNPITNSTKSTTKEPITTTEEMNMVTGTKKLPMKTTKMSMTTSPINPVPITTSTVKSTTKPVATTAFTPRTTTNNENLFSCNFELGWCPGWNQSNSDALDWTIGQGPTKTSRTGPGVDHTLGTKDGRYAYVEATGARFGRKAIFRTPFVDMNKHDKYCFRYWYHMYGSGMGNLKVIWSPPKQFGNNRKSLFLISTNSGSVSKNETDWILEEVNVISPKTFKYTKPVYFEFQATRGSTSRSDVAIDDVTLVPGPCQASPPPSIESSATTVPVTTMETSSVVQLSHTTTKVPLTTSNTDAITTELPMTSKEEPVVTTQISKKTTKEPISTTSTATTTETTTTPVTTTKLSTTAQEPVTTKTMITPTTSDETTKTTNEQNGAKLLLCDFEDGWCPGWKQSDSDALDWTIGQGPTKTIGTGPRVDHTLKTRDGRYAYVEATGARFGRKAIFRTPFVDMNKHDKYCFRYWYHMYGSGMGNLKVIWSPPKQFGNNRKSIFLISSNSGSQSKNETDWILEEVNVVSPTTFKYTKPVYFEFQATRGVSHRSDVAIDDVSLVPGTCEDSKRKINTQTTTKVTVTTTTKTTTKIPVTTTTKTTTKMPVTTTAKTTTKMPVTTTTKTTTKMPVTTTTKTTTKMPVTTNTKTTTEKPTTTTKATTKIPGTTKATTTKMPVITTRKTTTTKMLTKTPALSSTTCGGKIFDYKNKKCCNGYARRAKNGDQCCGKRAFSPKKQGCCGVKVFWLKFQKCCGTRPYPHYFYGCCNGRVYRRRTSQCSNGIVVRK